MAGALSTNQKTMIPRVNTTGPQVKKPLQIVTAATPGVTPVQLRQQNRLNYLQRVRPNDAQIGKLQKSLKIPVAPKTVNPENTGSPLGSGVTPINFSNTANAQPTTTPDSLGSSPAFVTTRTFEPENYAGSPLYKFQVQEGQKQLGKSLAARGLTNSGHAIEEELNIPLRAAAQDTDRMTRIASENADRYKSYQDNEALRQERSGNEQWNRSFSLAQLMADQSPWNAANAGLNNYANTVSDAGQSQANFLKDFYNRVIASGGGRSGGGGAVATPIPLPSGPDYSNISPTSIGGNYSSNSGWLNILTNGLSSLLGGK